MATVNSRKIVDELLAADGWDSTGSHPVRCVKIVEYTNAWGGQCYGLIYEGSRLDSYQPSQYVINPKTLWEAA